MFFNVLDQNLQITLTRGGLGFALCFLVRRCCGNVCNNYLQLPFSAIINIIVIIICIVFIRMLICCNICYVIFVLYYISI